MNDRGVNADVPDIDVVEVIQRFPHHREVTEETLTNLRPPQRRHDGYKNALQRPTEQTESAPKLRGTSVKKLLCYEQYISY